MQQWRLESEQGCRFKGVGGRSFTVGCIIVRQSVERVGDFGDGDARRARFKRCKGRWSGAETWAGMQGKDLVI
jgi:hypothetical protein